MDRPASTVPSLTCGNVPAELKALSQWVAWRYELAGGKWTKVPYDVTKRRRASTTNPHTWSVFDVALEYARGSEKFDGIGFVFSRDDPYCGFDLDDCLLDGRPVPEAREILDRLDSYAEISPSKKGVKIWVKASLPTTGTGRKTTKVGGFGAIEMYQYGRFFTVTGWRLQ